MVKGFAKKEGTKSEKLKSLEEVFGKERLEGRELLFQDCFKKLSLGKIEKEDFSRGYVKTSQGYIYVNLSSGIHYIREQNI